MRRFILSMLAMLLAACTTMPDGLAPSNNLAGNTNPPGSSVTADQATKNGLEDLGPAPELANTVWLNTDHPLRLAGLRGKVVLIEMWTFLCINCLDTVPTVKDWYHKYAGQGLVIIGNHYPEFDYERDLGNLKAAIAREGITYPVAQDNDGATWTAYHNEYWPTIYLIDKTGHLRYRRIGEGSYDQTEAAIQALLAEKYPTN
jgi:thiol-disulfide isomerase/thioredoxin